MFDRHKVSVCFTLFTHFVSVYLCFLLNAEHKIDGKVILRITVYLLDGLCVRSPQTYFNIYRENFDIEKIS